MRQLSTKKARKELRKMLGSMMTPNSAEGSAEILTLGAVASDMRRISPSRLSPDNLSVSVWIPREVGCRRCREIACMDLHEQVSDDEIAVHYVCPDCGWQQTRHFHESELDADMS